MVESQKDLIIKRLKELYVDSEADNVSAFAKKAGIDQSLMSKYLEGKRDFTMGSALKMKEKLSVNPIWILTGENPKYVLNGQDKELPLMTNKEIVDNLKADKQRLSTIIDANLTAMMVMLNALHRHDVAYHQEMLRSLARLEKLKKQDELIVRANNSEGATQIEEMKAGGNKQHAGK